MSRQVIPGGFGEVRVATTAGGGTALTTTATRIVLPLGTQDITLVPRNFAGATVIQWMKNPWLTVLKTTDLLVTQAAITDYSNAAQDGSTSTIITLSSLATLANGGALYIGAPLPFSGVEIDVQNTNSTGSILTVKYWNGAWTDTSATDGTTSGGNTFNVDGNVTWTMPTDWVSNTLLASADTKLNIGLATRDWFWTRWEVSVALDASTTVNSMIAINRSTTYDELVSSLGWEESVMVGPGGICSVQAKTDAGTANLIVSCKAAGRFVA